MVGDLGLALTWTPKLRAMLNAGLLSILGFGTFVLATVGGPG